MAHQFAEVASLFPSGFKHLVRKCKYMPAKVFKMHVPSGARTFDYFSNHLQSILPKLDITIFDPDPPNLLVFYGQRFISRQFSLFDHRYVPAHSPSQIESQQKQGVPIVYIRNGLYKYSKVSKLSSKQLFVQIETEITLFILSIIQGGKQDKSSLLQYFQRNQPLLPIISYSPLPILPSKNHHL